jgi:hypothetical protein
MLEIHWVGARTYLDSYQEKQRAWGNFHRPFLFPVHFVLLSDGKKLLLILCKVSRNRKRRNLVFFFFFNCRAPLKSLSAGIFPLSPSFTSGLDTSRCEHSVRIFLEFRKRTQLRNQRMKIFKLRVKIILKG